MSETEEWGCSPSLEIGTKADEILFPIFQEVDGGNAEDWKTGLWLDAMVPLLGLGRMHLTGKACKWTALESVTNENCGRISGNAGILNVLLDVEILVYIIAFH